MPVNLSRLLVGRRGDCAASRPFAPCNRYTHAYQQHRAHDQEGPLQARNERIGHFRGSRVQALGSTPRKPVVVTTTVVSTAMLVTVAEFRTDCVRADTTRYWLRSTAPSIELLLSELNRAIPALLSISIPTTKITGEVAVSVAANAIAAIADRPNPQTVSVRQPNLSDNRPLTGPITTM